MLLKKVASFCFLALTADDNYLVGVAEMANGKGGMCVWQVSLPQEGKPSLKVHKRKTLEYFLYLTQYSLASQFPLLAVGLIFPVPNKIELYDLLSLEQIESFKLSYESQLDHILFTPQADALMIAGMNLAVAGDNHSFTGKTVHLWSRKEKKLKFLFSTEQETVTNWQFLSDGKLIAYITEKFTFCIRDVGRNYALNVQERIVTRLSSLRTKLWLDERYVYPIDKNKIAIMSLQKFTVRKLKGLNAQLQAACFAMDEQLFYTVDEDSNMYAYQTAMGKELLCKPLKRVEQKAFSFSSPLFSRFQFSDGASHILALKQGNWLATKNTYLVNPTILSLFRLQNQEKECKIEVKNCFASALSQEGHYIVLAHQEGLEIWHTASKQRVGQVALPFHPSLTRLVLSPNIFPQALIVTCEPSKQEYATKVWAVNWERRVAHLVAACPEIQGGRFLDNKHLIFQQQDKLIIWNHQNDQEEKIPFKHPLVGFACTRNGSLMVTIEHIEEQRETQVTL